MYHRELSEQAIISGFRKGDANIIREYFYGYCQAGYYIFDQRYQLSEKENLDFMSLAHQYAIYLMEHDWKPLEDHSPNVSLKTWLINGFRYVVLDALKWSIGWWKMSATMRHLTDRRDYLSTCCCYVASREKR